ncbi:hypothetical protein [Streptomyces sp. F-1]|uniref:hypothetical protein n=1 Tax=Streptomyces sp. F-1 TaxID=463642 RepID=UPI00086BEF65|nr:hypothetical protein [Streptomyces sp. F-1]SFY48694.1 hypothetical protein STEPF1_01920 [Streptomyces sp. F-1]
MADDIPDELVRLERTAEDERAKLAGLDGEEYETQWRRWRDESEKVQAAITEHASGRNRYELEQAIKRAVRHASGDSPQ